VVGRVVETGPAVTTVNMGDRVVLEPALGCTVRGFDDLCRPCHDGHYANCERVREGAISAGIQTGFCRDTGGGWSPELVAHERQLHHVPDEVSDEAAVMVEPLSCAIHGVLEARIPDGSHVLVVGCGTIGLLTIAVLRSLAPTCMIVCTARYPHQRELARALGADHVVTPGRDAYKRLSDLSGGAAYALPLGKPAVLGGFDVTFECTGSASGIEDAIRWTRSQGQLVISGMPSPGKIDLAPLWYQELRVSGAYTYSIENHDGASVKTFHLALDIVREDGWGERIAGLVRHRFSLKEHRTAIATAMRPGRSGAVKTVFDFTQET
jgi:threonine dehydrogenase-like Zn-dependent dehydrogenase